MALTARRLNRATLARQLLLDRGSLEVVDGVQRVLALQAQEAASPYIALWNRLVDFDPADVDAAFADGSLLKASLMRVTLHAVAASDHPMLHQAMQQILRAARLHDRRFKVTGLTVEDAEGLIRAVREFTVEPRANAEIDAWLGRTLGERAHPGIWWALRQIGPFVHAPTGGPWSFGQRPSYRAAPQPTRTGDAVAAMGHLVRRYLEAFGPATSQDIRTFGMLYAPAVNEAIAALGSGLITHEGPDGRLFDVPDGPLPSEDSPAPPRLLGMWDSVLLAYKDRSRIIPPAYRRLVIQSNGDVLPTLLVDGYVAGVWRPVNGAIEATAFHALTDEDWQRLASEATALVAFLADREPAVYRRYARWWDRLSGAEVRLLPD